MTTYWQAEIYKLNELYDIDFPPRLTTEEATLDALERLGDFSERERPRMSAYISQWRKVAEGQFESTGDSLEVTELAGK